MRWPARSPATGRGDAQVAALARALAQSHEASVIGGGRLSLAGATLAQRLSDHRRHDVRRASRDDDARHAGSDPAGAGDRRARRQFGPRSAGRDRRRLRGDDADRHRARLPGVPPRGWHGPGVLGPFGAAAAVGRLRGFDAEHHGARVRARRQPGRRHLRGLGHADGEIPPMPRRAVGADGRAAGASRNSVATREFLTAKDGGLYQHLRQRRQAGLSPPPISAGAGSSSRSRCGCGRRPSLLQGHEHRSVRSDRTRADRSRRRSKIVCVSH